MEYSIEGVKALANSLIGLYENEEIEGSLLKYIVKSGGYDVGRIKNEEILGLMSLADERIVEMFDSASFPVDIEVVVDFLECLVDQDKVAENGIIFTPMYISDYIVSSAFSDVGGYSESMKIIDPGCGCGIFLISAVKYLSQTYKLPVKTIVENNVFGIDLDFDNVRRCKIAILLFELLVEGHVTISDLPIIQGDSLKTDWCEEFEVGSFELVVGNPPYVNPHDMSEDTAKFLKETFQTTKAGTCNIFYAFIEHGIAHLSENGILSYIVPNNFLTIKSARGLRKFLRRGNYIRRIINFADNMIFSPTRTYNCIITVSKPDNEKVDYFVMPKTDDVKKELGQAKFEVMPIKRLDDHGWHLVDGVTAENIKKIESQFYPIGPLIRTGIATLRDSVYIVDRDNSGFFKMVDDRRYPIESGIVKRLYKVPALAKYDDLDEACSYIIFPYIKGTSGFEVIPEAVLRSDYPKAYEYLLAQREELNARDKGNCQVPVWYAFGRTQGLNKYGKKLLYPTFSNKPRFTLVADEEALFCNGYAVFEDSRLDLEVLARILNSSIMDYYVRNTSYSIEGGYYCYQKKYIERFSVPFLSKEDMDEISKMTDDDLERYLVKAYELVL